MIICTQIRSENPMMQVVAQYRLTETNRQADHCLDVQNKLAKLSLG